MAFAPAHATAIGCFVECDYGKNFHYTNNSDIVLMPKAHGGKNVLFPHLVYVGPLGETRMALVLNNVAHIVIDEINDRFVIQKWHIKKHRKYR